MSMGYLQVSIELPSEVEFDPDIELPEGKLTPEILMRLFKEHKCDVIDWDVYIEGEPAVFEDGKWGLWEDE